jgi:hypothetical protein
MRAEVRSSARREGGSSRTGLALEPVRASDEARVFAAAARIVLRTPITRRTPLA